MPKLSASRAQSLSGFGSPNPATSFHVNPAVIVSRCRSVMPMRRSSAAMSLKYLGHEVANGLVKIRKEALRAQDAEHR